jgi:hypothetical protein
MDIQTILLTVAVVGGFTALLSFISYRQKQSSWKGEVVGKFHEEAVTDDNGSSPERYKVTFKTESGKRITVDVFEKEYNEYHAGDKAEKKAGEYFPTKIT